MKSDEPKLTDEEANLIIGVMPLQSLPSDVELVVQRIRDEISSLPADCWDGYLSPEAVSRAIDRAATKGDR